MATIKEIKAWLGSSFFIGFDGLDVPEDVQKFIHENQIGGITLFATNYENPAQVAELCNQLQALKSSSGASDLPPIFIAVDHEGGKVQRFKKPFTKFPPAHVIGYLNSPKLCFEVAEAQSRELKAVGINTVFAPVADINTNPKNPIIGERAFGDTEELVSKMVSGQVRGFITHGIQPCVKHFPGHGDTNRDSHFHLPRVSTSMEVLMERELRPFQKAFKSHCNLLMTAHIILENFEPKLPCTLSAKVLKELLRDKLRYQGLIITDDMEMKAISDHFGKIDAAVMALEAGADILLYHTMPFIQEVYEPLMSKLTSPEGKTAVAQLQIAHEAVMNFRKSYFMPYKPIYIPEIMSVVGSKENQDLLKRIEKEHAKLLNTPA